MRQLSRVTMSMRGLDRLKCVQAVIDGELRTGVAAARLAMSPAADPTLGAALSQ